MQFKGSSYNLPAHWAGGARARNLAAHFASQNTNSVDAKSEGAAEGGCGGNSAAPEPKRSPAALLVQSRGQQKSFLFLLEEKIGCAQNQKSRENFFAGWRALASGGGTASLVWFWSGISDKMSSSRVVKTHQNLTFGKLTDFFVGGAQRRPCVLPRQTLSARRAQARLAVGQDEVRAKDFFGHNLFLKKVVLPRDLRQIFCLVYPFSHRFEPASPLLLNPLHLLFKRLLIA